MLRFLKKSAVILSVALCSLHAEDLDVSFSGMLDADVWSDLTGEYFTNHELDLGMSLKFSDKVSANVYATVNGPNDNVPAGYGSPDSDDPDRWVALAFDGYDITFDTDFGTFSVGDLVYQYGCFNYYFYKRTSMITPESFTRGLGYSITKGMITQGLKVGISDAGSDVADIIASTGLQFDDNNSLSLYYGLKNQAKLDFETGTAYMAGAEYLGGFGALALKFDFGYLGLPAATADDDRTNVISVLFEPSYSYDKFSIAATAFYSTDGEEALNLSSEIFGVDDEMFFYVEPGYSFNDYLALGLPLEYHAGNTDYEDDDAIWIVPTFYVYPFESVEWWIWGQVVLPTADGEDNGYGIGSEIIVNF